jgi:acetyltransferase-like isoleucine patch superfamily enzyme/coenzyme F420-reducing hydrogenase beta subunit
MTTICQHEKCSGCGVCVSVCPVNAITMQSDNEGFNYPFINQDCCISCNTCISHCPVLHRPDIKSYLPEIRVFGAKNRDLEIRMDSTSGGFFSGLADYFWGRRGAVCGAVYNKDWSVSHILGKSPADIEQLRSSKYLQSSIWQIFPEIKKFLETGKPLLVCSTPCQIAGLYAFLEHDYENLLTCDFICRGVNSPVVFQSYIAMIEKQFQGKVKKVKFKNKTFGWHRFATKIWLDNGSEYLEDRYSDLFMRGYLEANCFIRPSCHQCSFKGLPRQGDITLADFWGIERIKPDFDDNKGTSLVLINTAKGENAWQAIIDKFDIISSNYLEALADNSMLEHCAHPGPSRQAFFRDFAQMGFAESAKRHIVPQSPSWYNRLSLPLRNIARKIKGRLKLAGKIINLCQWRVSAYYDFYRLNYFLPEERKKGCFILNNRYCCLDISPEAQIVIRAPLTLGYRDIEGTREECRLKIFKQGTLVVNGEFNAYFGCDIRIHPNGKLVLGNAFINCFAEIICASEITIGDGCAISRHVVIRDYDAHSIITQDYRIAAPIHIGKRVWIGERAIIRKGVTIGDGAIIAAGSIVTKDIPPRCLAAGNPARVIRTDVDWK